MGGPIGQEGEDCEVKSANFYTAMALSDTYRPESTCSGVIVHFGELPEVVDRIESFLRTTLPKLLIEIAPFKANTKKPRNEKDLCAELGKRLNFAAHSELFMFHSEDPEDESTTRTLDYGAYPQVHFFVGGRILGAVDRIYAIEAKRLPTHTSSIDQPEREREYVVGDWKLRSSKSKRISGGIERFKESIHGATLERVGIIAFVQKHDTKHWLSEVNRWIGELVRHSPIPSHEAPWSFSDAVKVTQSENAGVTELSSFHERVGIPRISITHFWLSLN